MGPLLTTPLQSRAAWGSQRQRLGRGQPQQSRKTSFCRMPAKRGSALAPSWAFRPTSSSQPGSIQAPGRSCLPRAAFGHRFHPSQPPAVPAWRPLALRGFKQGRGGGPERPPPPTRFPSSIQDHPSTAPKLLQSLEAAPGGGEDETGLYRSGNRERD